MLRISTIIPAYNRGDVIAETLRTVLEQTRPPHEVIVVDDGSSDNTAEVVAGFGDKVQLIRQDNAGAGPARNVGFARSTGDIVHFMDSDDLSSPNSYAVGAAAIERGADMTYGPWLKTRIDGNRLDPEPMVLQQGPVPRGAALDRLALLVDWVTVFQPCFFHRSLIKRAGPYRSDLKPSEDTELLYRILVGARAPVHTPESILLYRVHPENQVSEQNLAARLIDRANLWSVLQQHLDARSDLAAGERRRFRRKKYDVACEVRPFDRARAQALAADAGLADRALRPARRLSHRIGSKWRVVSSGNPYTWSMAAAPLREPQREQIRQMGYVLPDQASAGPRDIVAP